MLTKLELESQKNHIIILLKSTGRKSINELIDYLLDNGFFEAPASQRFHGVEYGGLAKHSLAVYDKLVELYEGLDLTKPENRGQKPLELTEHTFIIAGLLHDVCKIGAYVRTKADTGWTNTKGKDKGHGALSVERIAKFIELTPLEDMMIRFHMGLYHAIEYDDKAGEYNLLSLNPNAPKEERYGKSLRNVYYHNPLAKLISIADELTTMEEKTLES